MVRELKVRAGGHSLECQIIERDSAAPWIVFLHEGLGSVSLWRDFPQRCSEVTGCNALVYSRYGYGKSDVLREPRYVRYMHEEALTTLPDLLDQLKIERPILVGHSDGGSIALIYAGGTKRDVRGVIVMAPHVFVEDLSIRGIQSMKRIYETTELRARLARHHADPDLAFRGWSEGWLNPDFLEWNIEEYLPRIACPILAIQGEDDEYGTMVHLERIAAAAPRCELAAIPKCGHSPHRDQPDAVLELVARFVRGLS